MERILHLAVAAVAALAMPAVTAAPADEAPAPAVASSSWDMAGVARRINAAREARKQGDAIAAEQQCRAAFQIVEDSALAAYDAYADRLQAERRAEAATVRSQSSRLHELLARQRQGTQPTSSYLGFSTSEGLQAYADLLRSLGAIDESERMRSLALAYQQVQQAQFARTQLLQQGKDPRGAC